MGAALVATAAVGVLVAHRSASSVPERRYVVATRELPAGTTIRADDLGTVAADLPDDVSAVPEEDVDQVIGRVARSGMAPMDLVRSGDVFEPGRFATTDTVEIALDLSPAAALLGTLREGDLVDVLSTDLDGSGTSAVATGAAVTDAGGTTGDPDDAAGIGTSGAIRVRLALPDDAVARAVIDAAVRTEVTLALPSPARTDGAAP